MNLQNLPLIGKKIDERFLMHRLRSTSLAAMTGVLLTGSLYYYDYFRLHIVRWDLIAIIVSMALTKLAAMAWYHFTD
jgi:hypothetical protein